MKIKSINKIDYDGDVFNLRIKDGNDINNNYFANDICVSNCHKAKAKTIVDIMNRLMHTDYRLGVSGTFPSEKSAEYITIQSLMGPKLATVKYKELKDKGIVANVKIKALILNYNERTFAENVYNIKKFGKGKKAYDLEKEYAQKSEKRLHFLAKLVSKFDSNSLILFHNIEYGTRLYDYFRDNISDKEFYYIDGEVDSKKRTAIKKIMEDTTGKPKILIASFGTLSTGVSIKAIMNIVFADSFKSDQIIRQSIGRGLRLHAEKMKLHVFDIVDRFHKDFKNILYNHYISRRDSIYKKQEMPFEEINMSI
jgi:superfamily II DNA or RNA helicase